jgi:DNA/RNA-binding domain of Phe-tRNA-synthetase-like protein
VEADRVSADDDQVVDLELEEGWVATELQEEFAELRLLTGALDAREGRTPAGLRERLGLLANRLRGAEAVLMRSRPVPHAYRVFFRHIGLDPDATRTPVEAAAMERLMRGTYDAGSLVANAQLVALVETGVPVWAVDDGVLDGPLGLRPALAGERLGEGEYANDLPAGRLVVADAAGPVGVLFGDLAPGREVSGRTTRLRLFAVGVAGVPAIHVEEALWTCAEAVVSRDERR